MTDSRTAPLNPHDQVAPGRPSTTLSAFLLGLPLTAIILGFVHFGPLADSNAARYFHHPVEQVEVLLFSMALGTLAFKLVCSWRERRAFRMSLLPGWDGKPTSLGEADRLLAVLFQLPRRMRSTLLVQRIIDVLGFVHSRRSTAGLDDQLRSLADNASIALHGSYALTRFIIWAIPILGFLGTVMGITGAISGIAPEDLEKDIGKVTGGLALAFDTTALALALTMLTMFVSYLVERCEESVLDRIDQFVDRELAHRFEQTGPGEGTTLELVKRNSEILLNGMDILVQRQMGLWSHAIESLERQRQEAAQSELRHIMTALEALMEKTTVSHARRLADLDEQLSQKLAAVTERVAGLITQSQEAARTQQEGLARVATAVAGQVDALARLVQGEHQLSKLQDTLNQNLAAIAEAGAFEQALHSLTAAIHLLTARSAATAPAGPQRLGPRLPGAAA